MSDFLRKLDEALRFPDRVFHGAHSTSPTSPSSTPITGPGDTYSGYSFPHGSGEYYSRKPGGILPGEEQMSVGPLGETKPGHLPRSLGGTQLKPTGSEYSNPTDRGFGYGGFQATQPTTQSAGGDRDREGEQYRESRASFSADGKHLGRRGTQQDQGGGQIPASTGHEYNHSEHTPGSPMRRSGDNYALASYYHDMGASHYEGQGIGKQDVLGMGFVPSAARAHHEKRRSVGGINLGEGGGVSRLAPSSSVQAGEETRDQLGELGLEKQ